MNEVMCGDHWLETGDPFKGLIEKTAKLSMGDKHFAARLERELKKEKKDD